MGISDIVPPVGDRVDIAHYLSSTLDAVACPKSFLLQTDPNLTPRPALINPALRANQPECKLGLHQSNIHSATAQPTPNPPLTSIARHAQFHLTLQKNFRPNFPVNYPAQKPT